MSDERHLPKLHAMVENLGLAIAGRAADELLASTPRAKSGVVVTLPSWVWLVPQINVGRKGVRRDGSSVTMPVRVEYVGGPVLVSKPGTTVELEARIVGMGYDEVHSARVLISGDMSPSRVLVRGEAMSPVLMSFATNGALHRSLRAIVRTGTTARWEVISGLEAFARTRLAVANKMVAAELGEHSSHAIPPVLDEISLEGLLGKLLYGENGSSVISRMVDRSLTADTFKRVDPMRYFAVGIRARAEEAVRQSIGDPKVGPKVRRILAVSGATSLEALLKAYREAYPRDSLAAKRAIAALTAGPEVAAYQRQFHDTISAHTATGTDVGGTGDAVALHIAAPTGGAA